MVELFPAHGTQVELETLEVDDECVRQLPDGAPPLSRDAPLALVAHVTVVSLSMCIGEELLRLILWSSRITYQHEPSRYESSRAHKKNIFTPGR